MTEIRLPPFQTATILVKDKLRSTESRVFSLTGLRKIVDAAVALWPYNGRPPRSGQIIEQLITERAIRHVTLKSPRYAKISRYTFGTVTMRELGISLRPGAYLSHWSAAEAHGIASTPAPTIYVNKEQSPKKPPKGSLSQSAIDRAFASKQRTSKYVYQIDGQSFTLLNGKNTGQYGVESMNIDDRSIRVTNLPRTLIDVSVRPTYAGGVEQVAETFNAAREKIDIPELMAALQHINHKYPFHQALGYYLTAAGFSKSQLQPLRDLGLNYRFYLNYGMENPAFDRDWQIYIPSQHPSKSTVS